MQQWFLKAVGVSPDQWVADVATCAARWGADQELEACCSWVQSFADWGDLLRQDRRPQPSLKEQAIALLNVVETNQDACGSWDFSVVRRALEALPDD